MTSTQKRLLVAFVSAAVLTLAAFVAAPAMLRSFFYPKAPNLPPIISQGMDQFLARLQVTLATNAPIVVQALQPGLSDSQISALETKGGFKLSEDLRDLYRWRNGMSTNRLVGLLPGQRFLPLEEVVDISGLLSQKTTSASFIQRAAFAVFVGHKKTWLQILDDGAGDGYFYDPKRTENEGAFFYHFTEGGYFVWFPSVRNFLSGIIECYETGAIKVAPDGKDFNEDSERTQKIWDRLSKSSEAPK